MGWWGKGICKQTGEGTMFIRGAGATRSSCPVADASVGRQKLDAHLKLGEALYAALGTTLVTQVRTHPTLPLVWSR